MSHTRQIIAALSWQVCEMSQLTYICEHEQNTSHLFSSPLIKSMMSSRSMSFIMETKSATVKGGIRAKMMEVVVLLSTLAAC